MNIYRQICSTGVLPQPLPLYSFIMLDSLDKGSLVNIYRQICSTVVLIHYAGRGVSSEHLHYSCTHSSCWRRSFLLTFTGIFAVQLYSFITLDKGYLVNIYRYICSTVVPIHHAGQGVSCKHLKYNTVVQACYVGQNRSTCALDFIVRYIVHCLMYISTVSLFYS